MCNLIFLVEINFYVVQYTIYIIVFLKNHNLYLNCLYHSKIHDRALRQIAGKYYLESIVCEEVYKWGLLDFVCVSRKLTLAWLGRWRPCTLSWASSKPSTSWSVDMTNRHQHNYNFQCCGSGFWTILDPDPVFTKGRFSVNTQIKIHLKSEFSFNIYSPTI